MSELNVTVAGGKYTVIQREDGSTSVLRNGEPWAAYEGKPLGSLTLALAYAVSDLQAGVGGGWNFDISQAPRGRNIVTTRDGKNGPMSVTRFVPDRVIAASKCGKVTVSYFIPDEDRWCMFTHGEPPIAWRPWPEYPEIANG